MRVDKVILRAALSTLASILVLFGVMIFALCYIFPSTMMNIAYDLGMDGASITCARRSYERTDQIYYIAFATEVAILSEDSREIDECGTLFVADGRFEEYCAARKEETDSETGSYKQYVYGQLCVAKYRLGHKTEAVNEAFGALENGFPVHNAVVAVLFTAIGEKDGETVAAIKGKMEQMRSEVPAGDGAYFENIFALTNG